MKLRALFLGILVLIFCRPATAHELMIDHEHVGCDTLAPFVWVELGPGEFWQESVDLSQCSAEQLGWFAFYGVINQTNGTNILKVKDGIRLWVVNMTTGEEFNLDGAGANDPERIMVRVDQPGMLALYAENIGSNPAPIRLTWTSIVVSDSTTSTKTNHGKKKR